MSVPLNKELKRDLSAQSVITLCPQIACGVASLPQDDTIWHLHYSFIILKHPPYYPKIDVFLVASKRQYCGFSLVDNLKDHSQNVHRRKTAK